MQKVTIYSVKCSQLSEANELISKLENTKRGYLYEYDLHINRKPLGGDSVPFVMLRIEASLSWKQVQQIVQTMENSRRLLQALTEEGSYYVANTDE
jgi:hypothetical protein